MVWCHDCCSLCLVGAWIAAKGADRKGINSEKVQDFRRRPGFEMRSLNKTAHNKIGGGTL